MSAIKHAYHEIREALINASGVIEGYAGILGPDFLIVRNQIDYLIRSMDGKVSDPKPPKLSSFQADEYICKCCWERNGAHAMGCRRKDDTLMNLSVLEQRQQDTNPNFKPEIAQVVVCGRPITLGVVLVDVDRGWVYIEGEQFAVRKISGRWTVIHDSSDYEQGWKDAKEAAASWLERCNDFGDDMKARHIREKIVLE